MPALGIRQCAGQVFNGFFLRFAAEKLRIVGRFRRLTLGTDLLHFAVLAVEELHHIHRGDGKEDHQPQGKDQQHHKIGGRPPEQSQQGGTDGRPQHAAFPKAGLTAHEKHLDDFPGVGLAD